MYSDRRDIISISATERDHMVPWPDPAALEFCLFLFSSDQMAPWPDPVTLKFAEKDQIVQESKLTKGKSSETQLDFILVRIKSAKE